jgi:hypothetical protein
VRFVIVSINIVKLSFVTVDILPAVATGGILMEHFLLIAAGHSSRRRFVALRRTLRSDGREATMAETDAIVKPVLSKFYMRTLMDLCTRGASVNEQMHRVTSLMRHFNISMTGIDIFSRLGVGISQRTYKRLNATALKEVEDKIRSAF